MVTKTIKLTTALDERIQRVARATHRSYSVVLHKALRVGLEKIEGIDMSEALRSFIGSASGPGDLSVNKNYLRNLGRPLPR